MLCQETLFDFFQKMSEDLNNLGYPILDNIIHPFPYIKFRQALIKEEMDNNYDDNEEEFLSSSESEKE